MIPFNRPYISGKEIENISQAIESRKLSGDGMFTKKCQAWFETEYGFYKTLLTTSCTDALEMSAILLNIRMNDEVILPSYTFVSTANAFALRGARLVFADSKSDHPNIDPNEIERLITPRTKAIVVVHYAGVACDMDKILALSQEYKIPVIEDAAQAIGSSYKGVALGSFGALATFSFHETKNIVCGEGGLLAINSSEYALRAEVIREKGTNRSSFFRGEVDKYGWVDIGSSFLPSDILAAFLYGQIEVMPQIQRERLRVWNRYDKNFKNANVHKYLGLPNIPSYATNNAHMYYLVCRNLNERTHLIEKLKKNGVSAVFHYLSLHSSPFYSAQHDGRELRNSDKYTDCIVRLPMFAELTDEQVDYISELIVSFCSEICTF